MAKQVINGVSNYYGPRHRYEGVGGKPAGYMGDENELAVYVAGDTLTQLNVQLPAGATVMGNATVEVIEAFVLGGTTPVINIGVSGSEGTNRVVQLSQAQAQAVGTYSIASAGTLAANTPLTAAATITGALGGTAPTVTSAGKLKVVLPYRLI